MELYKRFPKLCLIWCLIEVSLYAGEIFGWSALMYILKDEGFYADECEDFVRANNVSDNIFNIVRHVEWNTTLHDSRNAYLLHDDINQTHPDDTILVKTLANDSYFESVGSETVEPVTEAGPSITEDKGDTFDSVQFNNLHGRYLKRCAKQDSRLNLWFSIGVGFSYVMCGFLGPLMRKTGMRFYRSLFM